MSDFRVLNYILIGDSCVGKTSLVRNFLKKSFKSEHSSTIGLEFSSIKIKHNEKIFKIVIWDTAGQERYHSIVRSYFKNALGAIFVYDITNMDSLLHLEDWLKDVKEYGNENVSNILVGNKNDMDQSQRREVEFQEGIDFAKKNGFEFFAETSAVDGTNVETVFLETFKAINDKIEKGIIDVVVKVKFFFFYFPNYSEKEDLKLSTLEDPITKSINGSSNGNGKKKSSNKCAC